MAKSFAWSYSVLSSFETCPKRHYLTKVSKEVSEGQSDEMAWGNKVHKALELRIKNKTPLPETLTAYEKFAVSVDRKQAAGCIVNAEQKLGIDINYQPVGFFAPTIWARAITDVTVANPESKRAAVLDWKTGKPTPASAQLKLCAAMTFSHLPWVDTVSTSFVWLGTGGTTDETYTRDQIPEIWQEFAPRVQRLEHALTAGLFPPKPSGLCAKWCPVPKRMCEHSGKL